MIDAYVQSIEKNKFGKIDPITGLCNRYYFFYNVDLSIADCLNSNMKFAILLININGFKEINHSLGIRYGDKILVELSKKLSHIKKNNYILSRINADEFAILCKFDDIIEIKDLAAELLDLIRAPILINNSILHINGRIGISIYPHDGENVEILMRSADIALSKANEMHQKKVCFFSREMYEESKNNFLYANYLTDSISNKELSVNYQPIFNIKNCKEIVGLEALLRWRNSTLGNVAPDVFIPLAEKSGQIVTIGEWVLNHVCKQIKFWQMMGYGIIPISVNISIKQLEQIDFSSKVINILNNYNLNPSLFEFEITESVSTGDIDIIVDNLKDLKTFGITISIDDFGTGFSSLGQLDFFEFDKIKIDKFFIDGIAQDSKKQKLLESIVSLGNTLELTIVAEGIETREQLSYLTTLDCQLGQGYLVSKPLPSMEAEVFLK